MHSRYGIIEINKNHPFSEPVLGRRISPYLQELITYASVYSVYNHAHEVLEKYLGVTLSTSTIYRTCLSVSDAISEDALYTAQEPDSNTHYVMVDGSMLYTDNGWQEAKVGRVINQQDIPMIINEMDKTSQSVNHPSIEPSKNLKIVRYTDQETRPRIVIEKSTYCAYLGGYQEFLFRFEKLIQKIPPQNLVFVTDGCTWIGNWIKESYPDATHILDYFHVVERMALLVKELNKEKWIDKQKELLLDSQIDIVINNIKNLKDIDLDQKHATIKYLENHKHLMDYKTYRQRNLYIGSGAIESAHRTLLQSRMKLSGQRWTDDGAQKLIKLRVAYKSNKEHLVKQILKKAA